MDLSEIPFDTPVILQSIWKGKNLHNPLGSKKARCLTDNRDLYEQLFLRRVGEDKIAIQSGHNGRFLQVRSSGDCVFDPKEPGDWELFTMETNSDCDLFFVSCHTGNVLQCNDQKVACCDNQNRLGWEAWRILEPRNSTTVQLTRGLDQRYVLEGQERQRLVVELARCGKTPDEIQQIVLNIFDAPAAAASSSALAVPVDKQ
ncbi:hypothetical protein PHMEG_00041208 [Phytophthora megakarya]|uniref:Uncharacterized protein n=1 Tax=Phytophthora megakarya TaxID=4795 RepID=A0A225UBV5_9STRA|nr:hypothetical protein PHMEG_00041208 [Phytophthora megakarya]